MQNSSFRFPHPVGIKGDHYSLLTLMADKKHILDIIKTLKFLPSGE
jgi:hypothetical protein